MIPRKIKKAISIENQLEKYIESKRVDDVSPENIPIINESIKGINYLNEQNGEPLIPYISLSIYENWKKEPKKDEQDNDFGNDFASQQDKDLFKKYIRDFADYSFVNLSGKPVIIKPFTENGLLKYEYSSVNDFKTFHRQDKFDVLNGKRVETVYFADQWIETGDMRKRYKNTAFDPSGKHDSDTFNFWKGYVEPIKGDHQPFIDHIYKLIKGTDAEKEYIINLLAYSVRFPDRLTGVSLAFRGAHGSGKSTISETMKELCQNHSKVIDSMDTLFDFNAETAHTKYFLMEESVWGGEISKQGKLKGLITCPTRAIKIKNLTGFDVINYGFFIFTSNEDWMLPVEKGDRRFSIFDCTKDLIDDFEYFDKYYSWLKNGGANALCYYFKHERNLENFKPKNVISNSAKTDIKSIGLPAIEKFILGALSDDIFVDCLTNVSLEQNDKEKYELNTWDHSTMKVNRNQLYAEFCENTKRDKIDQTLFSRKLAEIFDFPTNWKTNWKSGKNYYYVLPSKIDCMGMFARYLKEKPEQLFQNYSEMKAQK